MNINQIGVVLLVINCFVAAFMTYRIGKEHERKKWERHFLKGGGEGDSCDIDRAKVVRLHNEIDCRIEHGADSNGHLEYVRKELAAIIKGWRL